MSSSISLGAYFSAGVACLVCATAVSYCVAHTERSSPHVDISQPIIDSGADTGQAVTPTASGPPATTDRAADDPTAKDAVGVGAGLLNDSALLTGSGFRFEEAPPGWQPTTEGLLSVTAEFWSQPEFLALTQAQAEALMADEGAPAPSDVREALRDLPSREDAETSLRCPEAQAALVALQTSTWIHATMAEIPREQRRRGFSQAFQAMSTQRAEDEVRLWQALDSCGPFRHWEILGRLYRRWAK